MMRGWIVVVLVMFRERVLRALCVSVFRGLRARKCLEKEFQNFQLLGVRDGCSKGDGQKQDAFLYLGRGSFNSF